jgi:GNAT superfamily N-acetyltransferase
LRVLEKQIILCSSTHDFQEEQMPGFAREEKVIIRVAETTEAERLTEIAHAAKRHWGYPEEYIRLWEEELTFTPDYIADNPVYAAVALDGEIVGVYALEGSRETPELEHFWVDPGYMGRGIGRQLFRHMVGVARDNGASSLKIVSDPNAEDFYRKMGARRVGETPTVPEGRTLPVLVLESV